MVIIRLSRYGRKKKPFYHITVSDNRRFRNAKFIEKIGFYNPFLSLNNKNSISIDLEKFNLWIKNGARISSRVNYLIKNYKNLLKC